MVIMDFLRTQGEHQKILDEAHRLHQQLEERGKSPPPIPERDSLLRKKEDAKLRELQEKFEQRPFSDPLSQHTEARLTALKGAVGRLEKQVSDLSATVADLSKCSDRHALDLDNYVHVHIEKLEHCVKEAERRLKVLEDSERPSEFPRMTLFRWLEETRRLAGDLTAERVDRFYRDEVLDESGTKELEG